MKSGVWQAHWLQLTTMYAKSIAKGIFLLTDHGRMDGRTHKSITGLTPQVNVSRSVHQFFQLCYIHNNRSILCMYMPLHEALYD